MPYTILFTGHMIDAPGREMPRFPAEKADVVRQGIQEYLGRLQAEQGDVLQGIAGGACGGDILFHECCIALGIPTALYLAEPPLEFIEHSVAFAGGDWQERFEALCLRLPVAVLPSHFDAPGNVWERCNQWMLENALEQSGANLTLLALWDGLGGDGPGGTAHLCRLAARAGAATHIIPIPDC